MWCLSWFDILICQKKRSEFRVLEKYNFARCPNFTPILPGVLPNPKASYGPRIVFYERLSPLGEKHSIQLVAWKMDVVELPPWITSSSSMAALLCFAWVVECWAIFFHQHDSAYINFIMGPNPFEKLCLNLFVWFEDQDLWPPWITSSMSIAALLCLGCWMLSNFLCVIHFRLEHLVSFSLW